MKNRVISTKIFGKVFSSVLIAAMIVTSLLTGVGETRADPTQAASVTSIQYSEQASPATERGSDTGTAQADSNTLKELSGVSESGADRIINDGAGLDNSATNKAETASGTDEKTEAAGGKEDNSGAAAGDVAADEAEAALNMTDNAGSSLKADDNAGALGSTGHSAATIGIGDNEAKTAGHADDNPGAPGSTDNNAGEDTAASNKAEAEETANKGPSANEADNNEEGNELGNDPGAEGNAADKNSANGAAGAGNEAGGASGAGAEGDGTSGAGTEGDGSPADPTTDGESEADQATDGKSETNLAPEGESGKNQAPGNESDLDLLTEADSEELLMMDQMYGPMANYTLADMGIVKRNEVISNVDGLSWRVIKSQELNGEMYYLLVTSTTHHHNMTNQSKFGTVSSDYNGSLLQGRMTDHYNSYPTIRAIAVVPDLGSHSDINAVSMPTAQMALDSGKEKDIMFALSRQDYINWNNGVASPLYAPLSDSSYGQRSWSRTSRNTDELYGIINASGATYKGIDAGLNYDGYTNIGEIPAVWVKGGAVQREVNVYYVDTNGKAIGVPNSKTYNVMAGNTFTMDDSYIPQITGYEYLEWKKGLSGKLEGRDFTDPTLTKLEVLAGTDIYLIYNMTAADVPVNVYYVDTDDNPIGDPNFRTYNVITGNTFTMDDSKVPPIMGYEYLEWKIGLSGTPTSNAFPDPTLTKEQVIAGTDIYLIYNAVSTGVPVNVYYVDADDNPIGNPDSKTYNVMAGNTFTMDDSEIPYITGYNYFDWKIGLSGALEGRGFPDPTLTKEQVIAGTDIYLIYNVAPAGVPVTVHYIDKDTGDPIGNPTSTTYSTLSGDTFVLPKSGIVTISGYNYVEWRIGLSGAPSTFLPVFVTNVTSHTDIYLLYERMGRAMDEKNAYINGSPTAQNGTAGSPVLVNLDDKIKYTITANNYIGPGTHGAKYDILFVLDWSRSMDGTIFGEQSARQYERDIMLNMFDFITVNYPNSRVAVIAMNSDPGLTNNNVYTHIQYESDFLTPVEYTGGMRDKIAAAFDIPWKNPTEDLSIFLKAAIQKIDGTTPGSNSYYGNSSGTAGDAKHIIPRKPVAGEALADRTPVIVMISDFQIPWSQDGSGSYWIDKMGGRVKDFGSRYPNGILQTVRIDHGGNHVGGNAVYSTAQYDSYMTRYVSPGATVFPPNGHQNWGFTKVNQGTPYAEALSKIKDDFIALAPPGPGQGTIITDIVPEGLDVDISSISHDGVYNPATRAITWDLSNKDEGLTTVEFTVTVKQKPKTYTNTADVIFHDGTENWTNTTYHRADDPTDITITKTVKNESNKNREFTFEIHLFGTQENPLIPGQEFDYEGGVLAGSGADPLKKGSLTLNDEGILTFTLKHGQTITIKNIPIGSLIMVNEVESRWYEASFTVDGGAEKIAPDTGPIIVGKDGVTVDYVNTRTSAPPTGIAGGNPIMEGLLLATTLAILTGLAVMEAKKRRKMRTQRR